MKRPVWVSLVFLSVASYAADTNLPKTLAELDRSYVEPPKDQNAAIYFLQATQAIQITDADSNSRELPLVGRAKLPGPGVPLPPAMASAISNLLQRNATVWTYLEKGAKYDQSRYPIDFKKGNSMPIPHLSKINQASRLLGLRALWLANNGDGKRAAEALNLNLSLAQSLRSEPLMISQLIRNNCIRQTAEIMKRVLNLTSVPLEKLDQLQDFLNCIDRQDSDGNSGLLMITGEKLCLDSFFDSPLTNEVLDGYAVILGLKGTGTDVLNAAQKYPKAADRQFNDDFLDQLLPLWKQPFPERWRAFDFCAEKSLEATNRNFRFSVMMADGFRSLVRNECACLAMERLALTAVALERYRIKYRAYPQSLNELIPACLATVPVDPYDGNVLRYQKNETGYILHSIGIDPKHRGSKPKSWPDDFFVFIVIKPP